MLALLPRLKRLSLLLLLPMLLLPMLLLPALLPPTLLVLLLQGLPSLILAPLALLALLALLPVGLSLQTMETSPLEAEKTSLPAAIPRQPSSPLTLWPLQARVS